MTIDGIDDHEMRTLRWQNRQLGKALGRAGSRIHELRCELAEVREINGKIARGELRDYERAVARMDDIIRKMALDNAKLIERNEELHEKLSAAASVD